MVRRTSWLTLIAALALTLAACGDDGEDLTPRSEAPLSPTATTTAALPTAPSTGAATTLPSAQTPAASGLTRTPAATPARVDGTVDPLGFGGTEPVTIKSNPDPISGQALMTGVRIGVHPEEGGGDRIVFEFKDVLPSGEIAYVGETFACGSGEPVDPRGAATLRVRFRDAAAHDEAGRMTIPAIQLTGPGATLLEARRTCDFEGVVEWAVGVKDRQRFKITRLTNPTRVVIDIKQ